ncbi:MAG: enoyl-CoA hydratase/isomerase family protein [Leptospiraceae bacterium]|nr:enoyl-CoA hydratase/isomerase family protein [Leptospiraceae bacterium]MCB1199573.1 enoyl-CoA hydratase/isomerase family protein [Leptospiraceae bacterium]
MKFKFFNWQIKEVALKSGKSVKLGILTINAPNLNALSSLVLRELVEALEFIEKNKIRVFILTGEGKAFVAGADISEMANAGVDQAADYARLGQRVFSRIEKMNAVSIAAVNGFALGGGLELAMACDMRVFSDAAKVGLPEVTLGLMPGFGGTQRLSRLVGEGNAKYLTLTAARIDATEALRVGLAQKVVAAESLLGECESIATQILSAGPSGVASAKKLVHSSLDSDLDFGLESEAVAFSQLFSNGEAKEGISAFLEKRPADFSKF